MRHLIACIIFIGIATACSIEDQQNFRSEEDVNKGETVSEEVGEADVDSYTLNVQDVGAAGDGVSDDTDAIQKAIDRSAKVYLPATPSGYRITRPLRVTKPVILEGENTQLHVEGKLLFEIAASNVRVEKLKIHHKRRDQATTFFLDTAKTGVEKIYLQNLEVYDAFNGIRDANHEKNLIVNLHLEHLTFWHGQSTQIALTDAFAYIFLDHVTFDFTRIVAST